MSPAPAAARLGVLALATAIALASCVAAPPAAGAQSSVRSTAAGAVTLPPVYIVAPHAVPLPSADAAGRAARFAGVPRERASRGAAADTFPVRGLVPTYRDARLWSPCPDPDPSCCSSPVRPRPYAIVCREAGPGSSHRVIAVDPNRLAALAGTARTAGWLHGDWTVELGGRRYGVDPAFIHLGRVTVPTIALAAVPVRGVRVLDQQMNVLALDERRAQRTVQGIIAYHAPQRTIAGRRRLAGAAEQLAAPSARGASSGAETLASARRRTARPASRVASPPRAVEE